MILLETIIITAIFQIKMPRLQLIFFYYCTEISHCFINVPMVFQYLTFSADVVASSRGV